MAERKESKPTPRVLLMEFDVPADQLPEEVRDKLVAQGLAGDKSELGTVSILVPVGDYAGGPKHVIETHAKTRGNFRAISTDSYDQGQEAVPPEQQKFELRPLKPRRS